MIVKVEIDSENNSILMLRNEQWVESGKDEVISMLTIAIGMEDG